MKKILFGCAAVLVLAACKKVEGEGGKSSITGKITITEKLYLNGAYSSSVDYDGAKEDVYIVYGDDDNIYDDKVECNYDGSFKFEFLQPGTYTIYAYSELFNPGPNATNNDDDYYLQEAVIKTIEVGKKEDADIGTINLIK